MSDRDAERLSRGLHERADDMTGAQIGLDDVRRTARGIRRRRRITTGVIVAAVAVIAVPVGIGVADSARPDRAVLPPIATQSVPVTEQPTPTSTPDPTPSDTPTPTPTGSPVTRVPLRAGTEQHGGEPGIPYLFRGAINEPDGSLVQLGVDLDQVAALADGWVGVGTDKQGNRHLYRLDHTGAVTDDQPTSGDLAVSADGTLVSWATSDGRLTVAWDASASPANLTTRGTGDRSPVAVLGARRCDNPEGVGGCMVFYNQTDPSGGSRAMVSDRHGIVDTAGPFTKLVDVSTDGLRAGFVSATDTGSCSAVLDRDGTRLWKTCDYSLGRFSPDGRYVIGRPAYLDGNGDGLVAVLDARNGTPLVEYDVAKQAFLSDTVWDTDGSLLATLYDGGWALMRMTTDGTASSVSTGRIAGSPDNVPIHFSARP